MNHSGLLSVTMIKYSDPKQHDKKRHIWITLPGSSSSLRKVGTGSQSKNLERGTEAEATGECLTGLLRLRDWASQQSQSDAEGLKGYWTATSL